MRHFGNQKLFKIFFLKIENIFGRFFCSFQFSTNIVFQFAYLVMTVEYANMPNSRKNIFFVFVRLWSEHSVLLVTVTRYPCLHRLLLLFFHFTMYSMQCRPNVLSGCKFYH